MANVRTVYIENGDMEVPYLIYTCARCGQDVEEAWPMVHSPNGEVHCWECAFIDGLLSSDEFVQYCGVYLPNLRAAFHDGEIHLTTSKYFPWERPSNRRNEKAYTKWRMDVFKRDGFTCQDCGQVGGALNAHHLKPYKTHKSLRHKVDNGVTLCEKCHRKRHKVKG